MSADDKFDYKDTLLMPATAFEMKANLTVKEASYRTFWREQQIYQKALAQNKAKPPFILHDGPPYANGSLHVGHAINKILKDITVRYRNLNGFYAPFVAGWDTHGLPIENKMLSELKKSRYELDKLHLRDLAAKYAQGQIINQREQLTAFNLFTDFKEIYVTMDKVYEAQQLRLFKKMYFDGLVYKGLRPVFWSPSSQSALADAEVEYEPKVSPQIYVAFPLVKTPQTSLVIMTTTPWTLPANAAVVIRDDASYAYVKVGPQTYIVAADLVTALAKTFQWSNYQVTKEVSGKTLLNVTYLNPLTNKQAQVLPGAHVSLELGSGLVHTAPLFGEDDFKVGQDFNLELIMHVEDDGKLNAEAGEFEGQFYLDADAQIIAKLAAAHVLLANEPLHHQYPHDWRTHKPVIYRGTPQWFVSIEKIRPQVLKALDNVKSYPEWGAARMRKMIETRGDWTISRQRIWGVPITIFYDADGKEVRDPLVFDYVIDLVQKHGTNVWWERSTDDLLPAPHRNLNYTKEEAIVDVWFDSGSSSVAVQPAGLEAPFDLYLEGSDQYRGWFNSSLINSVAFRGVAPYKMLVSHGFVLDEKLQKMSKSKGNVVDPFDIINKQGADILRLWVANAEYTSDVSISAGIISQVSEIYRNIRTKLRFLLGNLNNWNESQRVKQLSGYDAYIAERLQNLQSEVLTAFDEYKYAYGLKLVSSFVTELSNFYLDFTKDTLYASAENSASRQAVLTNFYDIAWTIIMLLAPILVTTAEEAYAYLPKLNKRESVHLETIDFKKQPLKTAQATKYASLMPLKDFIYRQIEVAKKAGTVHRSQEVHFNLPPTTWVELLKSHNFDQANSLLTNPELVDWLMLGKLTFDEKLPAGIQTWVSAKCARCWKHFEHNSINERKLCSRCSQVLS